MSAIMAGVANTSRVPEPRARAVFDGVTSTDLSPLMPVGIMGPDMHGPDITQT